LQVWVIEAFTVACLLALGLFCVAGNRNMIKILIGINLMAHAVSLAFLVAGLHNSALATAQSLMVAMITVDAAVTAMGMALIVNAYRQFGSVDTDKLARRG